MVAGLPLFVSQSFAKNFGLYGERVGTFSLTCANPEAVANVMGQMDIIIRNLYSNPPKHGANIVKTVLSDPALYQEWRDELLMQQEILSALEADASRLAEARFSTACSVLLDGLCGGCCICCWWRRVPTHELKPAAPVAPATRVAVA